MAKKIKKKKLSRSEEFDIMKLVLDKFLWLGLVLIVFGLYKLLVDASITAGTTIIVIGAVIWILFTIILVKEYEIMK